MAPPSRYSPEFREEAVQIALRSSKTISEVARELELNSETLRSWVKKYQKQQEPAPDAELTVNERGRLKELERRNRELEMEVTFLKKAAGVLREGSPVASNYEFIDEMRLDTEKYAYSVEFMCGRLGVSRSGYYDWRSRPESATAQRREELKLLIEKAFEMSDSTYGHRRIQAQLHRWGAAAGVELGRRLKRELGLVPCLPRPKRFNLTQAAAGQVPDLVGRDFTADGPGKKLVGGITYIATGEGWLYLATVIDCCTKEVIEYAMDDHYQTPLISRAIRNAARNRNLSADAIFHSDRGSDYMSAEFGRTLDRFWIRRSAGRTGICFDNAMAESFFGALKNERVSRVTYLTHEAARQDITRYIEFWYNRKRFHSAVGYRPPREVHAEYERLRIAA
ncbi:IS3 family transposase [Streptomyces caniscabiei]|uniref:IS3 family transposase n=1 Tax=Streptomyces caniscabiei TaxID=2746961 RepID=A0A927LCA7_9ACTN|nr:IS3 family transposase [Streptomyces caniscabiei]MBD9730096.1 IS3 family transposase [Streptomyces caniscabiei]MDX3515920.1 IS3 family transposase [Streptomyces caniscabiei]MDX3725100.1 IS3 family transposase [Streptomyces caniscabiei]WEO21688.1 IS3 family transposase [Streptomyces caniscabiei]